MCFYYEQNATISFAAKKVLPYENEPDTTPDNLIRYESIEGKAV